VARAHGAARAAGVRRRARGCGVDALARPRQGGLVVDLGPGEVVDEAARNRAARRERDQALGLVVPARGRGIGRDLAKLFKERARELADADQLALDAGPSRERSFDIETSRPPSISTQTSSPEPVGAESSTTSERGSLSATASARRS
jgi:hypothetical protein